MRSSPSENSRTAATASEESRSWRGQNRSVSHDSLLGEYLRFSGALLLPEPHRGLKAELVPLELEILLGNDVLAGVLRLLSSQRFALDSELLNGVLLLEQPLLFGERLRLVELVGALLAISSVGGELEVVTVAR